jgi:hypothetical protein
MGAPFGCSSMCVEADRVHSHNIHHWWTWTPESPLWNSSLILYPLWNITIEYSLKARVRS